jgi:hypothetical protein
MREMYMEELYDEEKISSCRAVSHGVLGRLDSRGLALTNHCAGNTQALKLLAVVCARLGAVVRHENHLLACADC